MRVFNTLIVAALAFVLAEAWFIRDKETWSSKTASFMPEIIESCLNDTRKMLENDPTLNMRYKGYSCNGLYFQAGMEGSEISAVGLERFLRCDPEMAEAARAGKDWFHCDVWGGAGGKRMSEIGWSPEGLQLCSWDEPIDHAPCTGEV
ncbi:hypothetical protein Slin14017_G122710 [Septoria linicola]|nr:hypothetical protein Slin14017_G122710 [Septoria linicola]